MKSLVEVVKVNLLFGRKPEKDKAATWQLLNSVSNYLLCCGKLGHESKTPASTAPRTSYLLWPLSCLYIALVVTVPKSSCLYSELDHEHLPWVRGSIVHSPTLNSTKLLLLIPHPSSSLLHCSSQNRWGSLTWVFFFFFWTNEIGLLFK